MKRCVIVGAAPMADPAYIMSRVRPDDFLIAADGGYDTLCRAGLPPSLLVADFDSGIQRPDYPEGMELCHLPVRKDDTDTAKAVSIARERGYRDFLLLGCLGGRLDHTLANLQVLAGLSEQGCRAQLADEANELEVWLPGEYELPYRAGYGFSLMAYDPQVTGLCIVDAAYPAENITLSSSFPLGVSNGFIDGMSPHISFATGRLLVVCSKEE